MVLLKCGKDSEQTDVKREKSKVKCQTSDVKLKNWG
jgi:hypothetical protein